MTALPENEYPPGLWHDAYNRCLDFETTAHDLPELRSNARSMEARILGYLIREAPTPQGRDCLATEITSCLDDEALSELATLYLDHFIRCCASYSWRPFGLSHFSCPRTVSSPIRERPNANALPPSFKTILG